MTRNANLDDALALRLPALSKGLRRNICEPLNSQNRARERRIGLSGEFIAFRVRLDYSITSTRLRQRGFE